VGFVVVIAALLGYCLLAIPVNIADGNGIGVSSPCGGYFTL